MRRRYFFLLLLTFGFGITTHNLHAQEHGHGAGPNGGLVFDLGSRHAELTVDHGKQEITVRFLGPDEKSLGPVAAKDLVLSTNETKTADVKPVEGLVINLQPTDEKSGKAAVFVGKDKGLANVADFSGVLSGEVDGKPAFGEFDEAGSGHGHAHGTPHDGVVASLKNAAGKEVGFVELKLHDDKGDLELWIAKDREIRTPMDIPANSTIKVTFKDFPGKTATLQIRNNRLNEDEDGTPNLRTGKTNYFIFPGESGQDADWLKGKDFKSVVAVSFSADGTNLQSEEFVLVPHTHAEGVEHGHSHDEEHAHPHEDGHAHPHE